MQNKTDKGTSLVSKSLPVVNSNSVNRLFSARKTIRYVSCNGMKSPLKFHTLLSSFSAVYRCSNSSIREHEFVLLKPLVTLDYLQWNIQQLHLEIDLCFVSLRQYPLLSVNLYNIIGGQFLNIHE